MRIERVEVSALGAVMPSLQADQMGIEPDVGSWLAAFDDDGAVAGVARITGVGGLRTIDDVWVRPDARRRGIASALLDQAEAPVWLICDEDMISYYEQRGFALVEAGDFPAPLADLYRARNEWPATDHEHHAMVRRARTT
jgi:GNAT superfamily N-acetyltransferase